MTARGAVKRPTIADIARAAGVSKGAVSYALNGQPGVSEATRQRILAMAERDRLPRRTAPPARWPVRQPAWSG